MNLTWYKTKLKLKKNIVKFWYWLMKPIAYFFTTEKIDKRYEKKKAKITEEQAIKWMAEDIARYVIKYNRKQEILICDYANEEYFWRGCNLRYNSPYFKRDKTRMAYHKFKMTIELQEKIIDEVKKMKELKVEERVDTYTWQRIENYKKTYIISNR